MFFSCSPAPELVEWVKGSRCQNRKRIEIARFQPQHSAGPEPFTLSQSDWRHRQPTAPSVLELKKEKLIRRVKKMVSYYVRLNFEETVGFDIGSNGLKNDPDEPVGKAVRDQSAICDLADIS